MEEIKRDTLGFVEERCDDCGAPLYLNDEKAEAGEYDPICLNGCSVPGGNAAFVNYWKKVMGDG